MQTAINRSQNGYTARTEVTVGGHVLVFVSKKHGGCLVTSVSTAKIEGDFLVTSPGLFKTLRITKAKRIGQRFIEKEHANALAMYADQCVEELKTVLHPDPVSSTQPLP